MILSLIFGFFHLPIWGYILFTLIMTHITVISVTVFLHRSQAHRSLDLHPIISHFFRFWLWLTTSIVTKEWVAIHRKHHTECETTNDPHSPQILGLFKVLFEGAELYKAEAKNVHTLERYGRGTPNDSIEKLYSHKHLRSLGIGIMFLVNVILFGIPGITIWAVQMMWIPFFAAGVVNGIGHFWGYRNFECPDAARNIMPLGIIMGGEELHNNHHTFAASAKLSVRWWEFDIGWFYIRSLKALGLAKVHRSVPKLNENYTKQSLDGDSLNAIVNHRFHVMNDYWRKVIIPTIKKEKLTLGQANRFLRASGKLLVREQSLIKEEEQLFLETTLVRHRVLHTVYQYRLKLQQIWQMTHQNQNELLDWLHKWCKQAEETGILALEEFAKRLHYYSLQGA